MSEREQPSSSKEHGRREKRGRDRSAGEAGPSSRPDKTARRAYDRKEKRPNRDAYIDQIISRPKTIDNKTGIGSDDNIVRLKANYFRASSAQRVSILLYRVNFEPESEQREIRGRLISQHSNIFGVFIYDGANQLYLMNRLATDPFVLQTSDREGNKYTVKLHFARTIEYTEGAFLQVLNLILRNAMRCLNLQLVGRNFYDACPNAIINMEKHRLSIWPGYITSIRQHEHDVLINCEISHKVMRNESVLDIISDCARHGGNYRDEAYRKVVGSTVLTKYNNATYRVSDIAWDQNPQQTFEYQKQLLTLAQYYLQKYGITIRDMKQPLLVSKATARNIRSGQSEFILLVPELCCATGLTDEMRKNFNLMRDMSVHTRLTPMERIKRLMKYNERLQNTPKSMQTFQENNLTIDRQLVELDGRRLENEVIEFGNGQTARLDDRADWTQALAKNTMYTVKNLENWFFVFPRQSERASNDFLVSLKQVAQNLGMKITRPTMVPLQNVHNMTYIQELEYVLRKDPKFIVVVVPNISVDRYVAIKKLTLCRKFPVPIQVIVDKTLMSKRGNVMSIATKIAIQINCKLGGIPWSVDLRLKDIMIVGFDVSHDTNNRKHSYGAMVASLNPSNNGGNYFSAVNKHENGEQLSAHFGNNICAAARKYYNLNGALPKRILIFRDGVGDGQLHHVMEQEVKDIQSKLSRLYDKSESLPLLGFIVVNKKTNTRLFSKAVQGRSGRDDCGNPQPGTVVADVITLPERYDFYLVSQCVRQGTVSPTYYNVLLQDFYKNRPDIMQAMTYKLCHNYFNWSGTTKIPAVVQYAKKLAFFVGQKIHITPDVTDTDHQLYFL